MAQKFPKKIIIGENTAQLIKSELGVSTSNITDIPVETYIKAVGAKTLRNIAMEAMFSTNHFTFKDGRIQIKSNTNINQIAGHVFENVIVNIMRFDFEVGASILEWSTGYSRNKSYSEDALYGHQDFFSFYFSLKTVAKASKLTKDWDSNKYSHTSKHDVEFFIRNPNANDKSINLGGFQIKAINGNEKNEIIYPLLRNEYSCVLTLLTDNKNVHSYQRCIKTLEKMIEEEEITNEDANKVVKKISFPEKFGIPQAYITTLYFRLLNLDQRSGFKVLLKDGRIRPDYVLIFDGLLSYALESEEGTPYIISEGNSTLSVIP